MTSFGMVNGDRPQVIVFDWWRTLAAGPNREPCDDVRKILGVDEAHKEEFLRACLTVTQTDPEHYLNEVARKFGVFHVTLGQLNAFNELVEAERDGLLIYADVHEMLPALKERGFRLGLVTNCWSMLPVEEVLKSNDLDHLFDAVISSGVYGFCKQDGAEIYRITAQELQTSPDNCLMIGDNPALDYLPAIEAGMRGLIIDRERGFMDSHGNHRNRQFTHLEPIRNLDQLVTLLSY